MKALKPPLEVFEDAEVRSGGELLWRRILRVRDGAITEAFLEGARWAQTLTHRNILAPVDSGLDSRGPYVVMRLGGRSLASLQGGRLPPLVACQIALSAVRALRDANAVAPRGSTEHRALEPSNVWVGADGVVRIWGFGLYAAIDCVLETRAQPEDFRLRYISPLEGELGPNQDLFSVGCLLHEVVTGLRLDMSAGQARFPAPEQIDPRLKSIIEALLSRETTHWKEEIETPLEALVRDLGGEEDAARKLARWAREEVVELAPVPRPAELLDVEFVLGDPGTERGMVALPPSTVVVLDEDDVNHTVEDFDADNTMYGESFWGDVSTLFVREDTGWSEQIPKWDEASNTTDSGHGDKSELSFVRTLGIGEELLGYRIVEHIGSGAYAHVYRAQHKFLDREVAIKILRKELADAAELRVRMIREASALSALRHANLVFVYDFGLTPEGLPFIVMELLRGETLRFHLQRVGRFSERRVARVGAQLADALAMAHEAGVIHRDLNMENIVLDESTGKKVVKLVDFGLARLTSDALTRLTGQHQIMGTPLFMAPEQITTPERISAASDLYAVGVILHLLLEGRPPFSANTVDSLLLMHLNEPPPEIPDYGGLGPIVRRLLQKEPEDRFANAAELARALLSTPACSIAQRPSIPSGRSEGTQSFHPGAEPTDTVPNRGAIETRALRRFAPLALGLGIALGVLGVWRTGSTGDHDVATTPPTRPSPPIKARAAAREVAEVPDEDPNAQEDRAEPEEPADEAAPQDPHKKKKRARRRKAHRATQHPAAAETVRDPETVSRAVLERRLSSVLDKLKAVRKNMSEATVAAYENRYFGLRRRVLDRQQLTARESRALADEIAALDRDADRWKGP